LPDHLIISELHNAGFTELLFDPQLRRISRKDGKGSVESGRSGEILFEILNITLKRLVCRPILIAIIGRPRTGRRLFVLVLRLDTAFACNFSSGPPVNFQDYGTEIALLTVMLNSSPRREPSVPPSAPTGAQWFELAMNYLPSLLKLLAALGLFRTASAVRSRKKKERAPLPRSPREIVRDSSDDIRIA
jgi:hypothetical protein